MKKLTIYEICLCALLTAILCILSPIAIPVGPVPVTLGLFVIYLSVFILGCRGTVISTLLYLLLGLVGLPVFSGFSGGFAKLAGPTGGYLIGYVFVALIGGMVADKSGFKLAISEAGLLVGTIVAYAFGTAWYMFITGNSLMASIMVCVLPFIPFDAAKIAVAAVLGRAVHVALAKANLLAAMQTDVLKGVSKDMKNMMKQS